MSNYPILQRKQIVVTSLYNYIVSPARKTQIKYKNNQPNDILSIGSQDMASNLQKYISLK